MRQSLQSSEIQSQTDPICFLEAIHVLPAADISAAVAFYTQKLGFEKRFQTAEVHAILVRDRIEIQLWQCSDPRIAKQTSCRIHVRQIEALYDAYCEQGVIHPNGALETKPWGMKEFVALDRDGNGLFFQEPVAEI